MLVAHNIRVYSLDRDEITLSWDIADTSENLSGYVLEILRSQSPSGPFDRISPPMDPSEVDEFRDRGTNQLSFWREFFYRIQITQAGTGETWTWGSSDPREVLRGASPGAAVMEALPDLEALEAIRRFNLILQEYGGREVLVLRERTWGQRCRNCWDPVKRRVSQSSCQTCFGVGVTHGYFPPRRVRCMRAPHQILVALTPLMELQPMDAVRLFGPECRIKPRDLVVDTELTRWRVLNVQRSEKGAALIRATAQCRAITRDQVEYRIPVTGWGEDSFSVAPHRQYIRATDIDSYWAQARQLGVEGEEPNQIAGFPQKPEGG